VEVANIGTGQVKAKEMNNKLSQGTANAAEGVGGIR
jgi:hypothetical protein